MTPVENTSSMASSNGNKPTLKTNVLNYWEVLAQSIALISPTMTAALIVPAMYGTAGSGSWLAYAFAVVMLLFVALNLNEFAKRQTTSGSMYAYVTRGLGSFWGNLSGWSLIFAYLFIGMAGMTGFTNFSQVLLTMMGHPGTANCLGFALGSCFLCMATSFVCAYKDVQLSAVIMLILEVASVALIIVLAFMVLFHGGHFPIDTDQLTLKGASFSMIGFGVVVAIFSQVGFEAASAFGDEAKSPLINIPKAIIWSLISTGVFFVFITYTEVYGTKGSSNQLANLTAPLNTLATMVHASWMAVPLSIGAMVSFFSLNLSCLNSAARVMFKMGSHGALHQSVSFTHHKNETPHVGIIVVTTMMTVIITGLMIWHNVDADVFGYVGTFGAFGFLGAYFLISIAAPYYLKKLGEVQGKHWAQMWAAVILLIFPAVGSVYTNPPLTAPVKYFVYIYLAYMVCGVISGFMSKSKEADTMESVRLDLEHSTATSTH